ncbi:UNVERIFIED_CONTAM: ribosomal biogenesis LAS1 family protein, partial [Bacteroidetes bacterium 56_B9]
SMLAIAKQIGMPSEFVTLRHEATHDELPAIQRLVKAVDDALAWLWVFYWSKLEEPETEAIEARSLPELKARAKEIFKAYRGSRRE